MSISTMLYCVKRKKKEQEAEKAAQEWPQTFMFYLVKVGQLWDSSDGPLGLQAAHDGIH